MNTEQDRPIGKISYEKPTAVDLGPTAGIVGASCATGEVFSPIGSCDEVGNAAVDLCASGNSPGDICLNVGNDDTSNS